MYHSKDLCSVLILKQKRWKMGINRVQKGKPRSQAEEKP